MPFPRLDRSRLRFRPVMERDSKFRIEDIAVDPDSAAPDPGALAPALDRLAGRVRRARDAGSPVILCHGAHLVKNGLGPVVIRLVEGGWVTHVATNGAGSIHDWEFGAFGRSCEDVRRYVAEGQFGLWEETGRTIGLSLLAGAYDGLGYGEAVGRTMVEERVVVPSRERLREDLVDPDAPAGRRGAAADLLDAVEGQGVEEGELRLPHSHPGWSVQAACYRQGIPFTVHPGIGQDIIHTHPLFRGGPAGRCATTDFLVFAEAVRRLTGGVYISAGSSVMSPMIFEKSVSMARNLARQSGEAFEDFHIAVNDLAESRWDWSRGEPPPDEPAYYVRFMKSFARMGGTLDYLGLDNRAFLLGLLSRLR